MAENSKGSFVSIDFWNTIVIAKTNGDKRAARRIDALHKLAAVRNKSFTQGEITRAHEYASQKFDEIWLGTSRTPNSRELVGFTLESLGLEVSENEQSELARVYEDSLLDGPPELATGVEEAIKRLAGAYPLGIISDTMFSPGRVLKDYLDHKGIGQYFSAFAFSDEVGVSKPHPDMFEKIRSETGTSAEGSYHIGDIQQTDIQGAQGFGISAVLYTGISDTYKNETTADHVCDSWDEVCRKILGRS